MIRPFRAIDRRIVLWAAILLCFPLALSLVLDYLESRGATDCWYLPNPRYALTFAPGRVGLTRVARGDPPLCTTTASVIAWDSAWGSRPHRAWWFDAGSTPAVGWFFIPAWMPLSLYGGVVVWALRKPVGRLWARLLSPPPGHCKACRYDLSGLPPGAACPECGKGGPA